MKTNYNFLILILSAFFFSSCEKTAVQQIDAPPSGAFVRAYNFAVSGPSINFYIDNTKISATTSATGVEANTGVAYAGIFPANNSYLVQPTVGNVNFITKLPSTVATDGGRVIASIPATVEKGKYYSFFTSGIYNATAKTTDGFVLEDVIPAIDTGFAYVRFVNTISNTTTGFNMTGVHTVTNEQVAFAGVTPYKGATAFLKVPGGVYNLTSVSTGSTTYTITRNAVSFAKGFVYTIATRGNVTVAGNTGLDLTRNR